MSPRTGRILVVDDDPLNRILLRAGLEDAGHTVFEADCGRSALSLLVDTPIDAVLVDIEMPVMDGYEVLERRRADPALRAIPFIVISALDEMAGVIRCIELGAEDYLPKPFDPVLLRARLGASLERKWQGDELRAWNEQLAARVEEKVREVERLRVLQRFVAPQLAELIAAGGEAMLASHRSEISAVFCDLRGFTAFAQAAEPEDVMAVLSSFHEAAGGLVFSHQGTLAQFTGDGLLVFFNDPMPIDEPTLNATRFAVELRDLVGPMTDRWARRGHQLGIGMGIDLGYATCGSVGYEGRFEYTAIGTVVNLAARLCAAAGAGQILVSQRVQAEIEGSFDTEPIGELDLKGVARPMPTYNVVDAV